MNDEAEGLHTIMWHWSTVDDVQPLVVLVEIPKGFPAPDLPAEPQLCALGETDAEMLNYYAKKLG